MFNWEIILKGTLQAHQIEFPLQYDTFTEAESAFLHTVMEEQRIVYMAMRSISTLDVDMQIHRMKGLVHNVLRMKTGEVKTARYEFRTGTLTLRAVK